MFLFTIFFSYNLIAQGPPGGSATTLDNYKGTWSNGGSWLSGASPGATGLNVNVNVYGFITRYGDLNFNNGDLHVYDTLIIYGNLTLGNNADLFLSAGAILIVHGDAFSGNQVEVASGGIIIVTGTWTMDGSNNQGSFDNDGQLYIFEPGDGLKDGDGYADISCDTCVLGFDDLIDSDIGDFFQGGSYTITASGPTTFCPGESVTLSTTDTATNYQWYMDGFALPGENNYFYVATATGDYHVTFELLGQTFILSDITVAVEDNEPPEFIDCPTDITVSANDEYCGNTVSWVAPTANDNCGVTFTSSHEPGDFFVVGSTEVVYTAEDIVGNIVTCIFNVTVLPPVPPSIIGETEVCTPVEETYSTPMLSGKDYQWNVINGTITGSDTESEISVVWTGTAVGTVELTVTSGSGCSIVNNESIIKYATPVIGDIQSGSSLTRR